jgi:hypothetical protein
MRREQGTAMHKQQQQQQQQQHRLLLLFDILHFKIKIKTVCFRHITFEDKD